MWNPSYIKIENLFAHKQSEYFFKNDKCTVIFGKNNTDRGMQNNGAGKTTLLEGIAIALTNESLREVKKDSFINREEEYCSVDFSLENLVLKKKLRIVRTFYRANKPVKIELYENDVLNSQMTSVAEANKRVFELIGISREDLLRYFIISQDNRYTFFTASDSDKKEIMNRITSADMVNPVLEELNICLKQKEADYKIISDAVDELTAKVEILEEQECNVLNNDNTADELNFLKERKIEKETELVQEQANLVELEMQVDLKREELTAARGGIGDKKKLLERRKTTKAKLTQTDSELDEVLSTIRSLKTELDGVISCPKCNHEFVESSEIDLSPAELEELLLQTQGVKAELLASKTSLQEKMKSINSKIEKIDEAQELFEEIENSLNRLNKKVSNKKIDIEDIKEKTKSLVNDIKTLENRKSGNKILNSIRKQIKEYRKQIEIETPNMTNVVAEIEMIRYWQFHMGRNGFTTYLANKSVKVIEGITNAFLRKFDVDLSILINGFTVLKSGEIREKIDVFVQSDGTDAETFKAKSGGERGRVNLAGVLGIQHLINLSTNGKGLNLLCFDECFHGIDSEGQENIIRIMEKMGITILMITQNVSENFNSENKLFVVKDKKMSYYVDNLQS